MNIIAMPLAKRSILDFASVLDPPLNTIERLSHLLKEKKNRTILLKRQTV